MSDEPERVYADQDFGTIELKCLAKNLGISTYAVTFHSTHTFKIQDDVFDSETLKSLNNAALATALDRIADDLKRMSDRLAQGDYNGKQLSTN